MGRPRELPFLGEIKRLKVRIMWAETIRQCVENVEA